MRKQKIILSWLFIFLALTAFSQTKTNNTPPEWASDVIWYQIFVERFNNGDVSNDPTPESIYAESDFYKVPENWGITPWTSNWYKEDEWAKDLKGDFNSKLQLRRYGGDLQGVIDKLDYLSELGVTAIYFNPLNDAPSLHKFDARNWRHIDINFGPDPEGDKVIMASENPADPSTWKWTSADKLFLKLVDELHKRGIRVIVDYSWNHTGVEFWAMQDIIKKQEESEFKDWYSIESFDDPETPENEFRYHGWFNLASLPEIRKVDIKEKRNHGRAYNGNINKPAKDFIIAVSKRWLAPDGDISKGIDGYRLDVADQIGLEFWRDYRSFIKSVNPEAYLVGEIWWESWPDLLMSPVPYMQGDMFDAVMFYQIYRPARYFFANTDYSIDAQALVDSLNYQWNRIDNKFVYSMMNTAATHDAPRLLTSFYNKNMYKKWAKPSDDSTYKTGKPDEETYERVKLYLVHQFTIPGAPQIWNGDEFGMWGADDPDCRKPLWWSNMKFDDEYRNNYQTGKKTYDEVGFNKDLFNFYKKIISIRKENDALKNGKIDFTYADGKKLAYRRYDDKNEFVILFNLDKDKFDYKLEKGYEYLDLLTGKKYKGMISVNKMKSVVLKRI